QCQPRHDPGQARGAGRGLDRARDHAAEAGRAHPQRGGERGARARVVAAQHRTVPLRDRHADSRGADRAPPLGGGDPHDHRRRHARLPEPRGPARGRPAPQARHLRRLLLRRVPDRRRRRPGRPAALAVPSAGRSGRPRRVKAKREAGGPGRRAKAAARERGRLTLDELARAIEAGHVETVVTALPDLYGRLVGKRIHGAFFLDEVARHGMHCCDYLLACDMEMDPTPGYAYTNWAKGYGDLHAVPDLETLRLAAWLDRTAIVLCDAVEDGDERVAVAPR